MDISARKLNFVMEFLRLSDEKLIAKFEKLLNTERKKKLAKELQPMSMDEFNRMINESETDYKKGKATEASVLLKKVNKWK